MGVLRKLKKFLYRNSESFNRYFEEPDLNNPVFCSFDLETTGLDTERDEIISIGAVKIVDFKLDFSTTFYTLVKPEGRLKSESVLIHGIREEELEGAPPIEKVLPGFLDYIKGTVLVGYFITFDIAVLSRYTKKIFGFEILNPFIDLRVLYKLNLKRRYLLGREQEERSLDEVARGMGIEIENRHNALCDSILSAFVFLYFVKLGVSWRRAINF